MPHSDELAADGKVRFDFLIFIFVMLLSFSSFAPFQSADKSAAY
jgi:hypothetical protein